MQNLHFPPQIKLNIGSGRIGTDGRQQTMAQHQLDRGYAAVEKTVAARTETDFTTVRRQQLHLFFAHMDTVDTEQVGSQQAQMLQILYRTGALQGRHGKTIIPGAPFLEKSSEAALPAAQQFNFLV